MSDKDELELDGGFKLTQMVQAQRGLSDLEIEIFLATGQKPDLSQPPLEHADETPDDAVIMSEADAAAWLSGASLTASSFYDFDSHHGISPLYEVVRPKAFDFDPHQPRDDDGRWTDGFPGKGGVGIAKKVAKTTQASTKKATPAIIYKKHDDGAVVGHSASGQRMRWDAGRKKFIVEKQKDDGWAEESALTKTTAYNEMKNPDKWFEPSEDTSNAPVVAPKSATPATPPPVMSEKTKASNDVAVMDPSNKQKVLNEIVGTDARAEMMRAAVEDADPMGDYSTTYLARDPDGKLTGALAIKDLDAEMAEEQGYPEPYSYVEFVGATEGSGAGTDLLRQAITHSLEGDSAVLHLQATPESFPYWEKQGFKPDPLDVGTELYGMDRKMMSDWLEKDKSDQTSTEGEIPTPPSEPEPDLTDTDTTEPDAPEAPTDSDVSEASEMVDGDAPVSSPKTGPEIPKQADAPTAETDTPGTYTGPTATNYEGVPKEVTDTLRDAFIADIRHARRVDARAAELRTVDPEKYKAWNGIELSQDDARAELDGAPPKYELDDALEMLDAALPNDYAKQEKVRKRLNYEASLEASFGEFSKTHGLGELTPEVKADLAKRTKEAFADKKVAVRVSTKTVEHILNDGRFKSQFESGKSKGKKDTDMRASVERLLFGVDDAPWQNTEKRPIYGYVAVDGIRPAGIGSNQLGDPSTDQLTQYGNVQVVLKDSVRSRTTAMFGDSLNEMTQGTPSPIDDPDWKSFTAGVGVMSSRGLDGLDRSGDSARFRSNSYAEAQIHGGVGVDDIEEVVFPSNPSAALKKQLDDAGIPYRVLNFKTVADGSDEERGISLRIAQQDKGLIESEITRLKSKIDDFKAKGWDSSDYVKDLAKYEKHLKSLNDALPLLEGKKSSPAKKVAAAKKKVANATA